MISAVKTLKLLFPISRAALLLCCLLWGSYILAWFRTGGFGLSLEDVLGLVVTALIFVVPISLVPFFGLGRRRTVIGVLAVCAGSLLIAEVFGRAQEIAVVNHYGPTPSGEVWATRWWPFRNHSIFYHPGHGWSGCD